MGNALKELARESYPPWQQSVLSLAMHLYVHVLWVKNSLYVIRY